MTDRKPEFPTPWRVIPEQSRIADAEGNSVLLYWRGTWPHLSQQEAIEQFRRIVAAVNAAEGKG